MPSKVAPAASVTHPSVGTFIDNGTLELVEVLGVGGYGVVYRAEDMSVSSPKSYAVKCLVHSDAHQTSRQRQVHIREIALHQIASAHPNVVTLHRVVEEYSHTYIIMDYAPDHDLFSQILHSCRYLGDDYLIKHVFLQMLDGVEYCHSLGIYHRDLKPENILCFNDGLRIAITDFGLATTEKLSEEFRTGSVYHMSPECQGGLFAPTGTYSPMFNDIWSLGIILLNLATGRNPWKSASMQDPTFRAYLRDPSGFLPTVLPISPELNSLLTRMLEVDWRDRITLPELRPLIEEMTTFYSEGVVFEGSMARCPWEAGMDIDGSSSATKESVARAKSQQQPQQDLKSHWSRDSTSDIVFATHSDTHSDAGYSSYSGSYGVYTTGGAPWGFGSATSSSSNVMGKSGSYTRPRTPLSTHCLSSPITSASMASMPTTPDSCDVTFGNRADLPRRKGLTIDTSCPQPQYYTGNASMSSYSTPASVMHTAVDYDPYSSSFFMASPASPSKGTNNFLGAVDLGPSFMSEDNEMASPSEWRFSDTQQSTSSRYSSMKSSIAATSFDTASPDIDIWAELRQPPQQLFPTYIHSSSESTPPPQRPFSPSRKHLDGKTKSSSIFNPIKFFPRSSPSHSTSSPKAAHDGEAHPPPESFASFTFSQASHSPLSSQTNSWAEISSPRPGCAVQLNSPQERSCRRAPYLRSPRQWFMTGKLFASTGAS